MKFLSVFLCSLVALSPCWGQADPASDQPLHINFIDGPGPAQPRATSSKGYVLQVTSAAGTPVAGAAVALRLPEDGPTGRFANGLRAWVAYSDAAGIARFPVIQWAETPGPVQVRVTAAKGSSHAGLIMAQTVGIEKPSNNDSVSVVSVPVQSGELPLPVLRSHIAYKPLVEAAAPASPQAPVVAVLAPATPKPLADVQPMITVTTGASPAPATASKPHTLKPVPPPPASNDRSSAEPTVSITNSPTGAGSSESHKKMWIIVGIAGGAGAAALLGIMAAHGAGAAAGSGSSSGVTIGAPTVTVSH